VRDIVLTNIKKQICNASVELNNYRPDSVDWKRRCIGSAEKIIPWLECNAEEMKKYVEGVLNAPVELRRIWRTIASSLALPNWKIEVFERQLEFDDVLRELIPGEVVSKVVVKYLTDKSSFFKANSRSDYPDLYLSNSDYSQLPRFRRNSDEYGAALKGRDGRPVRVPDGLEIKTCKDRVAVDCHHSHIGLHLVLLYKYTESNTSYEVDDVLIAFLRTENYHESRRNTTATTVKYSFNREPFSSLLSKSSH